MRIGVMSNMARTGKTTVMLQLAYLYSRSQKKKVAIFSTGSLEHVTNPLLMLQEKDDAATTGVFKAMLESRSISGEKLFDYAIRGGRDEVYIFSLFSNSKDAQKSMEFLVSTSKSVSADMTLIEISKDIKWPGNKEVLEACDVILDVFTPDISSIADMRQHMKSLGTRDLKRTVLVCNMYDPRIMSEKKLSSFTGKGQNEVIPISYNPSFVKYAMDGDMSGFVNKCVDGHEDFLKLRSDVEKLMQVLYDTPKRKRIIPVKDWERNT